jgi:DNA-binding NarL/FixJ family response regulator
VRWPKPEDARIVREGLVTVLSEEPDFEFTGFAEDGEQACEEYAKLLPDVLLLDLRMPKRDGLEVARELVSKFQAKVIILTTFDNDEDLKQSLKAGAKGYLLKEAEKEEIADAIRTVAQGGNYLPAKLGGKLANFAFRAGIEGRISRSFSLQCAAHRPRRFRLHRDRSSFRCSIGIPQESCSRSRLGHPVVAGESPS